MGCVCVQVSLLVSEGTVAYVFTSQGNVFRLREKDISAKLKILVSRMDGRHSMPSPSVEGRMA